MIFGNIDVIVVFFKLSIRRFSVQHLVGFILLVATSLVLLACSSAKKTESSAAAVPKAEAAAASSTPSQASTAAPAATPTPAPTPVEDIRTVSMMTCVKGKDRRLIELGSLAAKGCDLAYTKDGKRSIVAKSVRGTAYCEKVRAQMRKTLEASGFTCS